MNIGVLGISHKSADLALREHVARACRRLFSYALPVVTLSTCNRSEIYFSGEDVAEIHTLLFKELREEIKLPFEHALYAYFGRECFGHLARVTAGLDSAIVAESDIQRQVKLAYAAASSQRQLSSMLHFLFQKALKVGKEIRSTSPLFTLNTQIEAAIFEYAQSFFAQPMSMLFIGNSEINRKIIRYFARRGHKRIVLCTRSSEGAESFALDHGVSLRGWDAVQEWGDFQLVICGTHAEEYLVVPTEGSVRTSLIFDLSVPRVVDPVLDEHPCIRVVNIDDLSGMTQHPLVQFQEIEKLQEKILTIVDRYIKIYHQKSAWAGYRGKGMTSRIFSMPVVN
jgi:glutamyl-tRNA reductase